MAFSTAPGILAFTGLELASPARTPGSLGRNDQGDPRLRARLGDTSGCTGVRDGADASLPRWNPALPLSSPDRPPWMKVAEDEARAYQGATEETIQRTHNYAARVRTGQATMVGNDHPWCAAFVNWCLQQAGVDIENPTFADHVASKGRAHGFFEVKGERGDKGIPTVRNPRFVMLEAPVFGAIAMVTASSGHGHHVGFVYSQPRDNFVVLLGGNQDDRIRFTEFNVTATESMTSHLSFFFPGGSKWASMTKEPLGDQTFETLNKDFGIDLSKVTKNGTTR